MKTLPVVAIIADRIEYCSHPAQVVLDGYVRAVREVCGALALMLPASLDPVDVPTLVSTIDGMLLTGSPSNVAGERYGAAPLPATVAQDPCRDAVVFQLMPALLAQGIPLLGVCRGMQEMNVAFDGSLEAAVHSQPGRMDHREGDHDRPLDCWYADSHEVDLVRGGLLARLAGGERAVVNSLHHQGIERLGSGLKVEATATDGLIEAIAVAGAPQFTLAVQWHPEMRTSDDALSRSIFEEFGKACRERQAERLRGLGRKG